MNTERAPRRWPILLVTGALLAAGVGWFAWLHHWWLNSDGSAYLTVGSDFLRTGRLGLPDGTSLSWLDRPLYPLLLVAPWTIRRSLEASIWMSRLPLIVVPPVVAALTWRLTRSPAAAALAGLAALVQPWALISGASNLVPDGLTAATVVVAVAAATVAVVSPRARWWWLAGSLFAIAAAAGTKQTGLLGLVLVAVVVWVGLARPPRRTVLVALAGLLVAIVGAVIVVNGATNVALVDLPRKFVTETRLDALGDSWLAPVVALLGLALVVWAVPRCAEPLPLAGLLLVVDGVALGLYAAGSGLGQRNAATLPYGCCLLLGAFLGRVLPRARPALRWSAVAGGLVVVVVLGAVAVPRAVSAGEADARSWDSPTTRAATDWLRQHAAEDRVGCSLLFCSFSWFERDGKQDLSLLPQYGARLGPTSFADLRFDERSGWRGHRDGAPPCSGRPLVVTKSDERFGAIFECPLLRYLRCTRAKYVMVGGWNLDDTYDAARLIPYLEANPSFERVFASAPDDWPRVVAIYKVVAPPRAIANPPLAMSGSARQALHTLPARVEPLVLDGDAYRRTVQELLSRPPGATARAGADQRLPGDAIGQDCPTTLG